MEARHALEVVCSQAQEPSQLIFALRALELLPVRIDCSLAPTDRGLSVRAETEVALLRHVDILRDFYGAQLSVGPLRILYRGEEFIEEPYMIVRVRCIPAHFEVIRADLLDRGARILDAEVSNTRGVVRAVAPLARLLGYSPHVRSLTDGKALDVMWFSHYAPANPHRHACEKSCRALWVKAATGGC